jgi:hypothetical protein
MKKGDVVMIFGNPVKCLLPVGQAKLIKKISDHSNLLENWQVEYLDDEGHFYNVLIKKPVKVPTLETEGYTFETGV